MSPVRYRGGGGGGDAEVAWGPDFGESADGNTFTVNVAPALSTLALAGNQNVTAAVAAPAMALAGNQNVTAAPAMPALALGGNQNVSVALASAFTTSAILAPQDTWIPNVAGCLDNANKNATDLQLEGIVATRKDVYFKWDLTGFPAAATVTAATLTVNVKTAPVVSANATLNHVADVDEGWSETALTCSGALGLTSFQTWTAPFATTGEKSVALNATALTRIAARMGVGFYTIATTYGGTGTNCVLESADEGTNNAAGPRLTLSFTT